MDGQTLDATLLAEWDAGLPITLSIDGLGMLFAVMGTTAGTAILIFSVRYMDHEKTGLTRFYTLMLVFIAGLLVLTAAANLLVAYMAWEVIGAVFLQPGRVLVHRPARHRRRAQGPGDDPSGGLRVPVRDHRAVRAHRHVRLERSGHLRGFHHRHRRCLHRRGDGQVGNVPAAHLDSRGDERADPGVGAAAFGLLRQGGRLSDRAHVRHRSVAGGVGHAAGAGRLRDHPDRRDLRPGADRPEAPARLPHGQPVGLYRHRAGARFRVGRRGRAVLLPQPRVVQGHVVHVRGRHPACHGHA